MKKIGKSAAISQRTAHLSEKGKKEKNCTTHCTTLLPLFVLMYIYPCVLVSFCVCRASVLDVNDETPTFNPRVYNVSLKESVPRDHTVARLSCFDNDAGLNAELSYFITGQRSQWEVFFCVRGLQCFKVVGDFVCHLNPPSIHPSIHACESFACGFYYVQILIRLISKIVTSFHF